MAKLSLVQPDFSRLINILNNTKEQVKENALYQVIYQLIKATAQSRDNLVGRVGGLETIVSGGGGIPGLQNQTYLTATDQKTTLPFSRELLAGTGILFDDSIPNRRTISSTGGGGSGNFYDSPLSDGDLAETDLIFANGECIIVQVPNP